MAVQSRNDVVAYTPPHRKEEENPPVYFIAPLMWHERAAWRRAVIARGAGSSYMPDEIRAAVRKAVQELQPDNEEELLATIDAVAEAVKAPDDPACSAVLQKYAAIERSVSVDPEVAEILAAREYNIIVSATLAAAYALRGWENVPLKFVRRLHGGNMRIVPDELIGQLPIEDVFGIGLEAQRLMFVSGEEAKNSDWPQPSPGGPESLTLN